MVDSRVEHVERVDGSGLDEQSPSSRKGMWKLVALAGGSGKWFLHTRSTRLKIFRVFCVFRGS